ncbi:MAG TPA: hypothetical protein VJ327_10995 [Patescibacteria group bacterium]|nr:hypothetical protein [Patescibacteria group bacterium]
MPNVTLTRNVTIRPTNQATIWGIGSWLVYRIVNSVEEGTPIGLHTVTPTVVEGTDPEAEEDLDYFFSYTVTPGAGRTVGEVVQYRFEPTGTEAPLAASHDWLSSEYTIVAASSVATQGSSMSMAIALSL